MADLSWLDAEAVGGVHYTYFVRAVGYAGASEFGTGAEGWRPTELRIVSSVLSIEKGVPFNAQLVAEGGRGPYTWTVYGYSEVRESSTFGLTGSAQGWQGDDSCWAYALPFAFPFFGKTYTTAYINSNGTIAFDRSFSGYSESLATLKMHPMIAVLWDDLKTTSGDVYVTETADSVTFRWNGVYYSGSLEVNFSATLGLDGTVRLSYGTGNENGGLIGISPGDGTYAFVEAASQSGSMANAHDIFLSVSAMPDGLNLLADGKIAGTPLTTATNIVGVMVTDANGTTAAGEIEFALGDIIFPPLGESATAADVESALSVGTDAGLTNITDVAVYEAFRQWVDSVKGVDGTTAAGAQAVKDSTRSWLSFAFAADALIAKELTSDDVKIEAFTPASTDGKFEFTVSVKDVNIGSGLVTEAVLKENLKKVLGIEGAKSLSSGTFSSDNIDITFDAPVDGKARFTVSPPVDVGNSFFMRVKVK